ncbi:MAG: AAA family ATPase [Alphaproteobacteria bacterium]|nr:AAA family ATPase [Alphaproteobacteria bacterium]
MRLFVTGTGTGVGKTVIAAALVRALGADYWKPIQSGARGIEDPESDTYMVRTLRPDAGAYSRARLHLRRPLVAP